MTIDTPTHSVKYRPEINWTQIVYNEILSVTNAMKRNQRWNRVGNQDSAFTNEPVAPRILFKTGDASHNSGVGHLKDFLSSASNRTPGSLGAPSTNQVVRFLDQKIANNSSKINFFMDLRSLNTS